MKLRKFLAVLLCLTMVFSMASVVAFAEGENNAVAKSSYNTYVNGVYLGGSYDNAYLCAEVYDFYLQDTFVAKYYSDDT